VSLIRLSSFVVVLVVLALPGSAAAHSTARGTGGAAVPIRPEVAKAVCEDAATWACARGEELTIEGEALDEVSQVRFVGGRGARDDQAARPRRMGAHRLAVRVPSGAHSGRIAVVSNAGRRATSGRRLTVRAAPPTAEAVAPTPAVADATGVFPIAGKHDYGTGINRFGGGRGHGGQDVFASCGTPLVAAFAGTVQVAGSQARAGNYVVLQDGAGASYVYMHMQGAATVRKGAAVTAGQPVGRVGDSGRATGCHLHFEQWTAPGWYEGGKALDPLPLLKRLDG